MQELFEKYAGITFEKQLLMADKVGSAKIPKKYGRPFRKCATALG